MSNKLSPKVVAEIEAALQADNLIGVVYFTKEMISPNTSQVVGIGTFAGNHLAIQADTLYEAIQSVESLTRTLDQKLAKAFGREVVSMAEDEEDAINRIAAVESLRTYLSHHGVDFESVTDTPTSLLVVLAPEADYEGPWKWEGYQVRTSQKA